MTAQLDSWGRVFPDVCQLARVPRWGHDPLPEIPAGTTALPRGLGRSYGDSCLNDGGVLLLTGSLDRFISFDRATGVLRCEAGVTIDDITRLALPAGWFVPVTPGTRFVTVGGAIANDVHGKNHHRQGTFGRHVRAFDLLRSDGSRIVCSPSENGAWYRATIGGLGLTGLITWAEVQLMSVPGPWIHAETIKFGGLHEFFALNEESEARFDYTVAWIDCMATGPALGRGVYIRGNHLEKSAAGSRHAGAGASVAVPFDLPGWVLGPSTVKMMCEIYYRSRASAPKAGATAFEPFFWPLDGIRDWNRAYGRRGFYQYQFVVPFEHAKEISHDVLQSIARARQASFVSVMKTFGDVPSPGLLSFPRPGVTLALDFANRGAETLALMDELDRMIVGAGGALYPAKDARMSGETFRASFPAWAQLTPYIDPRFSSSFWRRVTGDPPRH